MTTKQYASDLIRNTFGKCKLGDFNQIKLYSELTKINFYCPLVIKLPSEHTWLQNTCWIKQIKDDVLILSEKKINLKIIINF